MKFLVAVCLTFLTTHAVFTCADRQASQIRTLSLFENSRITNGADAVQGAYPYQVSLWWGFPPEIPVTHVCGGVILNNEWVLTAGHCHTDLPSYGNVTVYAGKHLLNVVEASQQSSGIRQWIVHPLFKGGANPDDIALVRLDTPFTFTNAVGSIALPTQNVLHTGNAIVTGWGSVSTNAAIVMPDILQVATVPIIDNAVCYDALFATVGATPLTADNICTGPLDNSGIAFCRGDSGGPLVQLTNGFQQLIGIVSWGVFPCGSAGIPSVFVRVSSYTNWITDQIAAHSR